MALGAKDRVCIVGMGETAPVYGSTKIEMELGLEAARKAIADAGLRPSDIDGIVLPGIDRGGVTAGEYALNFGIRDLIYTVSLREYGGAMGIASIEAAVLALSAGLCTTILVPHASRQFTHQDIARTASAKEGSGTAQMATYRDYYAPFGLTGVHQFYAWHCQRHMSEFGTNRDQLMAVALASRRHAALHPTAMLRDVPLTEAEYRAAPWTTWPFSEADTMIATDGAGAVVLTTAERARDLRQRPIYVMGTASGTPYPANDIAAFEDFFTTGVTLAARRAFAMAGVRPSHLDFVQIYDLFTFYVIMYLEEIGICPRGEGGRFVEGGRIEIGGDVPVNTHGGNLAHGSCQAMNHLCEAVVQLRGGQGERQIEGAEIGCVVGFGGGAHGAVTILRN